MKMLCIKGEKADWLAEELVAGQVYEVTYVTPCCTPGATADGVRWKLSGALMRCLKCGNPVSISQIGDLAHWRRDRFVKWDDPQVSKDEVTKLYLPNKPKELIK